MELLGGSIAEQCITVNFPGIFWRILNDIKNLDGGTLVLTFLILLVFEWFEYIELCGSS